MELALKRGTHFPRKGTMTQENQMTANFADLDVSDGLYAARTTGFLDPTPRFGCSGCFFIARGFRAGLERGDRRA